MVEVEAMEAMGRSNEKQCEKAMGSDSIEKAMGSDSIEKAMGSEKAMGKAMGSDSIEITNQSLGACKLTGKID